MDKYEMLNNMAPQEKTDLLNALKNTGNRDEAKRVLSEAGLDITEEDIRNYKEKKNSELKELDDEALSGIVGGRMYSIDKKATADEVTFIAAPGMTVEVNNDVIGLFNATVRCVVVDRKIDYITEYKAVHVGNHSDSVPVGSYYADQYYVRPLEEHWYFNEGWVPRSNIEMP